MHWEAMRTAEGRGKKLACGTGANCCWCVRHILQFQSLHTCMAALLRPAARSSTDRMYSRPRLPRQTAVPGRHSGNARKPCIRRLGSPWLPPYADALLQAASFSNVMGSSGLQVTHHSHVDEGGAELFSLDWVL